MAYVTEKRVTMNNAENTQFINTVVEIDETYLGGKPRKDNHNDNDTPKNKRGR